MGSSHRRANTHGDVCNRVDPCLFAARTSFRTRTSAAEGRSSPFRLLLKKSRLAGDAVIAGVCQAHSAGVVHGDLKTENIFVSSWNHATITDFATFKPLMLPQDDPSEFSFFFESDRNRHRCYLAPERFECVGGKASLARGRFSKELAAMDIFSLGCVLAEVFLDGQTLLDLQVCHDLSDAMPSLPPALRSALAFAVPLVAVLLTFSKLPAMRIENGSVDSCDPVRTYGEITQSGMRSVVLLASLRGGVFLDIGSGNGAFVLWAAAKPPEGGGYNKSRGVEVMLARHQQALAKVSEAAPRRGHDLIHGDILHHLMLLSDAHLVYWNNLCFSSAESRLVVEAFTQQAPRGATLVTLAELEIQAGALPSLSVRRGDDPLQMEWREEGYVPFVYTRH
eukprot:s1248_g5.t1